MSSVTVSGGLFNNHGLLRGNGQVANRFNNHTDGEVRANFTNTLRLAGISNLNQGLMNINFGGTIESPSGLTNSATGTLSGDGILRVGQFTVTTPGGVPTPSGDGLINQGKMNFSGTTKVFGDVWTQGGDNSDIIVSGGAVLTFFEDVFMYDDLNVSGKPEIRAGFNSTVVYFGLLKGDINKTGLGLHVVEGTLSPGFSPGKASVEGSLIFGQSATLEAELAGATPGSQHDQVTVTANVSINGSLDIALLNNFAPDYFDEFDILTAGSRTGEFDQINGALINPDVVLAPVYDHNGNIGLTLIAALPGDANLDGTVNGDDLLRWQANLFSGDEFVQGDFNLDGTVNGDDLLIWQAHLFDTVPIPATAPIPEPGTAVLLLGMSVLGVTTRRRAA